jgi:hypothetical protein
MTKANDTSHKFLLSTTGAVFHECDKATHRSEIASDTMVNWFPQLSPNIP